MMDDKKELKHYKAEYGDDDFEIIEAESYRKALEIAYKFEKKYGFLYSLCEI